MKIVSIEAILPHPDADTLVIIPISGSSWSCVAKQNAFSVGDKAIYIEPDYVVPVEGNEEIVHLFGFLSPKAKKGTHRLRAIKLRGVVSFGLLAPLPETMRDLDVGTDVLERLQIVRYATPEIAGFNPRASDSAAPPKDIGPISKYDIESARNFPAVVKALLWSPVFVTEKIHGANARFVYWDDMPHVGSRGRWLRDSVEKPDPWWRQWHANEGVQRYCQDHPGYIVYGELYGAVQSLTYGLGAQKRFAAFDIYETHTGRFLGPDAFLTTCLNYKIPYAPILLHNEETTLEKLQEIAEEDTALLPAGSKHMREGLVIRPMIETRDNKGNRVVYKLISNRYWLSGKE